METARTTPRSALIIGVSLAFGILCNYFFFDKMPPGIGFTLYIALIIAAFFGVAGYCKRPARGDLLWLFPLLLFFAAMVAVRANGLLTALNVLACLGLLLVIMEVSVQGSLRRFIPTDYLKLFIPFRLVEPFIATWADALSMRRHITDQKNITQIVRGILITIPVVFVLGLLLASADPIFERYASFFTTWNLAEEDIARIIFTAIATLGSVAFFSYALTAKAIAQPDTASQQRLLGHVETSILLGSINALFLAFIAIQITYLFGGESNIVAQGFTYAEYARRGFFELVAVAVLSYLVLVITERFIQKDTEEHSRTFKSLSSGVILQVGVIMLSAFYRMSLYEAAFGFTTLRVYVHAFIVLLGFVFACLLYKIVVEHQDNTFAFRTFLGVVVFVAGMNAFSPDAFIARKNLERFAATGDLDTAYLAGLSSDATPVLIEALTVTSGKAQHEIGHALYTRLHDDEVSRWMQWNWSRTKEDTALARHAAMLERYIAEADLAYPEPMTVLPTSGI